MKSSSRAEILGVHSFNSLKAKEEHECHFGVYPSLPDRPITIEEEPNPGPTILGTIFHGLDSSPINHQLRKFPTSLPTARSYGGIFSVEAPSSPVILACIKLT
ncbi:hypothetical protein H671_1g3002 [Cricetulus griseus]|uniref:Uncharacterized protein n=1 Tax=Cricetulus griseus TaxID=10029 RepID=A0A061ILC7_CRIGR|nr:hypothetical protein H671_1g3002 [Cricetulus griseus]